MSRRHPSTNWQDNRPTLSKTSDYGKTWIRITSGIPEHDFTRVIREDPGRPGLLYAGTETGVYVSFDDGAHWQSMKLGLPVVPVHRSVWLVKEGDLVRRRMAAYASGILDHASLTASTGRRIRWSSAVHLFEPETTVRFRQSAEPAG